MLHQLSPQGVLQPLLVSIARVRRLLVQLEGVCQMVWTDHLVWCERTGYLMQQPDVQLIEVLFCQQFGFNTSRCYLRRVVEVS